MTWQEIRQELFTLDARRQELMQASRELQVACKHLRLPKRGAMQEFCDTCPDCGFVSYCYHA